MITDGAIQSFCDELAGIYHPDRIVLFGSYAGGQAREDSDVDLLVVMTHAGRAARLAGEMVSRLKPAFSVDLLVRDPSAIEARVKLEDPFILDILAHGKVLHEAS